MDLGLRQLVGFPAESFQNRGHGGVEESGDLFWRPPHEPEGIN